MSGTYFPFLDGLLVLATVRFADVGTFVDGDLEGLGVVAFDGAAVFFTAEATGALFTLIVGAFVNFAVGVLVTFIVGALVIVDGAFVIVDGAFDIFAVGVLTTGDFVGLTSINMRENYDRQLSGSRYVFNTTG